MHFDSFMGFCDLTNVLLEYKANINITKYDGTTPLFYASQCGHTEVAQLLLDNGASPELYRSDGKRPLDIATRNGYFDIVFMIMKHECMFSDIKILMENVNNSV